MKEHPLIPVTSLPRTHLDLAVVAPERLPDLLQSSEDRKLSDLRKFESLLSRTAAHPGHGPLRKALAELDTYGTHGSPRAFEEDGL